MSWIDSHCHLDFDAFPNVAEIFKQLTLEGCERVLVPAISAEFFQRLINLKDANPKIMDFALGLHPYFLSDHKQQHLDKLNDWVGIHKPNAIGEIGLDYMLNEDSFDLQKHYFQAQIEIAQEHNLPVIIHCRKAHDLLFKILKDMRFKQGGFIHGFSGSQQQAKRYLDGGFALGLGGALTHDRAKSMHKLVAYLPDDGYVLETDSPDMAPAFAQGAVNTPLNVPRIAQNIASLRNESIDTIFSQSTSTYYRTLSKIDAR